MSDNITNATVDEQGHVHIVADGQIVEITTEEPLYRVLNRGICVYFIELRMARNFAREYENKSCTVVTIQQRSEEGWINVL